MKSVPVTAMVEPGHAVNGSIRVTVGAGGRGVTVKV